MKLRLPDKSLVIKISAMMFFFIVALQSVSIGFHAYNAKLIMQLVDNNFRKDLDKSTENRRITQTRLLKEDMSFLAISLGDAISLSLYNLNREGVEKSVTSFLKNKNITVIQVKERNNEYFAAWSDGEIKTAHTLPDNFKINGLEKIHLKIQYADQDIGELVLYYTDRFLKKNLEQLKNNSVASLEKSIQTVRLVLVSLKKFELIVLMGLFILVMAIVILFARSISKPLKEVIDVLSSYSSEVSTTVVQQESISQQQALAVQQTNKTMKELGSSSKLTLDHAKSTAINARNILKLSTEGQQKMKEMVLGMDTLKDKEHDIAKHILHLSEQTTKIGEITSLVSEFANETKMLAMNAAVEAVRAGEHGKGFSVLSVEIRKLADESKGSAERIRCLVTGIQKVTNAAVMATEEGTKNVDRGSHLAKNTSETFQDVSFAIGDAAETCVRQSWDHFFMILEKYPIKSRRRFALSSKLVGTRLPKLLLT